jgi:hypothetical protein
MEKRRNAAMYTLLCFTKIGENFVYVETVEPVNGEFARMLERCANSYDFVKVVHDV